MFLSCIWNRQCWYYCSLSQGKEDEQKPRLPQDSHALTCLKCQALLIFITWNIVWMVRDPKIHCHFLKIRGSLSHMFISLVSQMVTNLPAMLETQVRSLGWGGHLEKGMATHSSALAWRSPWREEPGEIRPWGHEESAWLSDYTIIHGSVAKPEPRNPHLLECELTGLFLYLFLFFLLQLYYTELAKTFVWVFPYDVMEKPEWTFWPTL